MGELATVGRQIVLEIYWALASMWNEMVKTGADLLNNMRRDARRNPGLMCALAGVAIIIVWLATGGHY